MYIYIYILIYIYISLYLSIYIYIYPHIYIYNSLYKSSSAIWALHINQVCMNPSQVGDPVTCFFHGRRSWALPWWNGWGSSPFAKTCKNHSFGKQHSKSWEFDYCDRSILELSMVHFPQRQVVKQWGRQSPRIGLELRGFGLAFSSAKRVTCAEVLKTRLLEATGLVISLESNYWYSACVVGK